MKNVQVPAFALAAIFTLSMAGNSEAFDLGKTFEGAKKGVSKTVKSGTRPVGKTTTNAGNKVGNAYNGMAKGVGKTSDKGLSIFMKGNIQGPNNNVNVHNQLHKKSTKPREMEKEYKKKFRKLW